MPRSAQCPICFGALEVRLCAPYHACGGDVPTELEHLHAGRHTYATYEVRPGRRLTLCDFCVLDLGSYRPEALGLPAGQRLRFADVQFVAAVAHPRAAYDQYCPGCGQRLAFLRLLRAPGQAS
ncbi:hypothetical protein EJV47_23475 [Hymenobacter gummosus]|uniref:Uncharacterized protein n=1 Tax=Hymenobacter gummosus TaxID=1776032 RepID=A0A3S0HJQ4_9BACT|nr:hypothetical protein [Hymenobacter gummosus]RTQ45800.1 hypothetical protein EJV47_23475 [Hymenobacter gummosus]